MTTAIRPTSAPLSSSAPLPYTDEEQLAMVGRRNFGRIASVMPMPNLIQIQVESFDWFKNTGLQELFEEISPITDFTGKNMELRFLDYHFGEPRYSVFECRQRDMTYAAPLRVRVQLLIKETGEIKESEIFMGDFPLMTETGTFVINGAERVVVSQLVRSPGVYFTAAEDANTGRQLFGAKLIPNRGAWLEFESSNKDVLSVKVDRKRKIPVTILLRAIGYSSDEELEEVFKTVNNHPDHNYIRATIDKDATKSQEEAVIEFYKRLRPGDPPTKDNAENLRDSLLFNARRYDLAKVGRYKLNKRLGLDVALDKRVLTKEDLLRIVSHMIELNNIELDPQRTARPDDIDHLGNRRVRAVGELIQAQFRVGLLRMERVIKERMSIQDPESASPGALINIRPVVAAMREFFGGSQLSQFMDQTNPLSELNNKRRLSALGPGGLSRDRAGFDVRDVHESHYGRICPVETPEGPNIGLIGSMATYARINEFGFIETPYLYVLSAVENNPELTEGHILNERVEGPTGEAIAEAGTYITRELAERLTESNLTRFKVRPKVANKTDIEVEPRPETLVGHILRQPFLDKNGRTVTEAGAYIGGLMASTLAAAAVGMGVERIKVEPVRYVSADVEDNFIIVQANARLTDTGHFQDRFVTVRHHQQFLQEPAERVNYMDVSPKQVVSVATALIPFLEHDDANRALMGANMQRQAVPLLVPSSPIVGTGIEWQAARDSGQVLLSRQAGVVIAADASRIVVRSDDGEENEYQLQKFVRSNQDTCINQRPLARTGQRVRASEVIADSSSSENGELALGQNILVAFMSFEGGNFEDAILLSQRLVQDDVYTSIHIEKYEVEARETKLGPEEITRDIPNVGEESLKNLDERGIIYVGAEVQANDILVGKITPKGETELTPEERLLRAIFGEKAREVKDTSLRVPHGVRGKVIDVKEFSRANNDELPAGVSQMVRVSIAQKRKISVGDKMAGRHGNKGVISRILPPEDMPFLPDGTPVDIILNPLGVPHRMNIGQILETHLGWAAGKLGYKVATPVFDGATEDLIHDELERAGLPRDGKVILYDGRTGEAFDNPVTVGQIYMLKLAHLVEDKIHARSTGPYSLVTQQPLGGKAQFGGQRFGEMEVWALEAYGAAHTLQEMLTVKSDDVVGRVKTYEAIVKGENIMEVGVPESFKVLIKELQSLGLDVEVYTEDDVPVQLADDTGSDTLSELEGINLSGFEADERERV